MADISYTSGPEGYTLRTGGAGGHPGVPGGGGFPGGLDIGTIMGFALNRANQKAQREEAMFRDEMKQRALDRAAAEEERRHATLAWEESQRNKASKQFQAENEPIFGVPGPGGMLSPYTPGVTAIGGGQAPVAMGYRRR
jgi:hypothetical protein